MFAHRELDRCFAQKQGLIQQSEVNRTVISSELSKIRHQTEYWLDAGMALAQKVAAISSNIFSVRCVTGFRVSQPLAFLSSAFAVAQALIGLWSKGKEKAPTTGGITSARRDQNPVNYED